MRRLAVLSLDAAMIWKVSGWCGREQKERDDFEGPFRLPRAWIDIPTERATVKGKVLQRQVLDRFFPDESDVHLWRSFL